MRLTFTTLLAILACAVQVASFSRSSKNTRGTVSMMAEKSKSFPFLARPAALDGSAPGDVGFDPLGFTENFQNLRYLQQAELKHGRVAMLATVGFATTQYIHLPGDAYQNPNPLAAIAQVGYGVNLQILFGIGIIELINWENTFNGDTTPGDYGFDGGLLKNKSEKDIATMRLKEIKHGRLAMVAIIGMIWAYIS